MLLQSSVVGTLTISAREKTPQAVPYPGLHSMELLEKLCPFSKTEKNASETEPIDKKYGKLRTKTE